MTTFGDLFTERQLVALSTLGEVLKEGIQKIESDSLSSGLTLALQNYGRKSRFDSVIYSVSRALAPHR